MRLALFVAAVCSLLSYICRAACNTTVMFRKDNRAGLDDSFQQMKLVRWHWLFFPSLFSIQNLQTFSYNFYRLA